MIINNSYFSYNIPKTNFGSHIGHTDVVVDGKTQRVNNYTSFFRNFLTLDFTKDYLIENFPLGTNIAEFGCSLGQKPYSLMVMLDSCNQDKKYKMKAFDFPEVLEQKEIPLYGLSFVSPCEKMLFGKYDHVTIDATAKKDTEKIKLYRDKFFECFDKYTPEQKITYARWVQLQSLVSNPDADKDSVIKAKEELQYDRLIKGYDCVVKTNQKGYGLVDFQPGDINNIDKLLDSKKQGAVIFQNALYHLLKKDTELDKNKFFENIDNVKNLFSKVNNVLAPNGIFVIGNLPQDHLYDYWCEEDVCKKTQDGKEIYVYDSSVIHSKLKRSGFEPVYYEKVPKSTPFVKIKDVYLPAVWKKVSESTKDVL